MAERNYTLEDVKEYLYESYGLYWAKEVLGASVNHFGEVTSMTRRPRIIDFNGDQFSAPVVLYMNGRKVQPRLITATNEYIKVGGYDCVYDDWQDFLDCRHKEEQCLIK